MPDPTCNRPAHHRRPCTGPAVAVRIIKRGQANGNATLCLNHRNEYREDGYGIELASATVHELKIDARWFAAVLDGTKPFEVRRDGRGYQVGDVLVLREWGKWRSAHGLRERADVGYTGRTCRRTVTFILRHEDYEGIAPGYCVLGLAKEGAE